MATEKETLIAQAEELGLDTTDEAGKQLTIAQLKVAITAAQNEEDGEEDDEPPEDVDPDEVKVAPTAKGAKKRYKLLTTVMRNGERLDPHPKRRFLFTESEAMPLVKAGAIEEV